MNKELYKKAYEQYKQWNEAEVIERARSAGRLSPKEAWRQYVDLWEFIMRTAPPRSPEGIRRRLIEWNNYYERIQIFEDRRRDHGRGD